MQYTIFNYYLFWLSTISSPKLSLEPFTRILSLYIKNSVLSKPRYSLHQNLYSYLSPLLCSEYWIWSVFIVYLTAKQSSVHVTSNCYDIDKIQKCPSPSSPLLLPIYFTIHLPLTNYSLQRKEKKPKL